MASLLFRETKGMNFSCASPASAAVCSSLDQRSMIRPSTIRAGDRHALPTREAQRAKAKSNSQKSRKSSEKPSSLMSPASSSRCLLEDNAFLDVFPDGKLAVPAVFPTQSSRFHTLEGDGSAALRPSSSKATGDFFPAFLPAERSSFQTLKGDKSSALRPSSSTRQQDQVVVLRVSLHCKGCEGKVRRHISKMEGVTSFSIDMASKKVTVVGDVTPLSVLNSISKVKNAQLWSSVSPPRASASF